MPNEVLVPQQIPIELIHDLPDLPRVSLPDKAYGGLVTSILLDGVKSPLLSDFRKHFSSSTSSAAIIQLFVSVQSFHRTVNSEQLQLVFL